MIVSISCEVSEYIPGPSYQPENSKIQRIKEIRKILLQPTGSYPGLKFCKDLIECIMKKGKARINVTESQLEALQAAGFFCQNVDLQNVRFNDAEYYQNRRLEAISAVCVGDWKRAKNLISELQLLDGDWDTLNDDTSINFLIGSTLETED